MNAQTGLRSSRFSQSAVASADFSAQSNTDLSAETALANVAEQSLANAEDRRPAADSKICWIEVKQYPYQPDHQVELLHLQAEADALLLQLQARKQQRLVAGAGERR